MKMSNQKMWLLSLAFVLISASFNQYTYGKDIVFKGDCDASTAIATGSNTFFAIGDERKPKARLYKADGRKLDEQPLKSFLASQPKEEPDLEASAKLKDTVFVIGSHGRDDDGKVCPERNQLFAFKYDTDHGRLSLTQVGSSFTGLYQSLISNEKFAKFGFDSKPGINDDKLAPKKGTSINIEGLAAAKDDDLLLGLRSPLYQRKAIVIPLINPFKLVKRIDIVPVFGAPIPLDLNGQGIRSIEYWPDNNCYLIVSGNVGDVRGFQVFKWTGDAAQNPKRIVNALDETAFNPEAIVVFPGVKSRFMLLSDDGTRKYGTEECKNMHAKEPRFVGRWYEFSVEHD